MDRRPPGLLPVELDRKWLVRFDRHPPPAQDLEPRVRKVVAPIGLREHEEEVTLRDVSDEQHVEDAVVRKRLRTQHDPAPDDASVRDDAVDHAPFANLAIDRDSHPPRLPAEEDRECRPVVRDLAAERFRGLVRAPRDRTADARAADVREVGPSFSAGPGAKSRPSEVDLADVAGERGGDRILEAPRDTEATDEVPTRPPGDDCKLDSLDTRDPVHGLVD